MQELQCHTSILKKVRAKVIQFLCILFLLVKANHNIRGVNIFQYTYLYRAYADDTTYFLKNKNSIRQLMETFSTFSQQSCLKPNYEKCEIAGIGILKSVKVAVCGMKCVDLCKDTIRITGVHFRITKPNKMRKISWKRYQKFKMF